MKPDTTRNLSLRMIEAFSDEYSASRRLKLRTLVWDMWTQIHDDDWGKAFLNAYNESPIINGTGADQIKIRPSFAALRDCLSDATCTVFVAWVHELSYKNNLEHPRALEQATKQTFQMLLDAIEKPAHYGVDNPKSKTNYELGFNIGWIEPPNSPKQLARTVREEFINTWNNTDEPMEKGEQAESLSQAIDIVDAIEKRHRENGPYETDYTLSVTQAGDAEGWDIKTRKIVASAIAGREHESPRNLDEYEPSEEIDQIVARVFSDAGTVKEAEDKAMPTFDIEGPLKASLEGLLTAATDGVITDVGLLQRLLTEGAEAKSKAKELESAVARTARPAVRNIESSEDKELPKGDVKYAKAYDAMGMRKRSALDFDVPMFEWEHPHPMVPELDSAYIFRPESTLKALIGLTKGVNTYAVGHTGSGKTTLFLQIASRLNWPVIRVNFDSEITRLDLVGRDVLRVCPTSGVTVSEFVEGVLPTAIAGPFILLCDEVDRVRPEVSYVFQRALEDQGILLNEDGGRLVSPHDWHRIVATANTVGQGDEYGLYQGARHQSQAFLDRFTNWIEIDYLSRKDEMRLLKEKAPGIGDNVANTIMSYVHEHRAAFVNAEILQPISARAIEQLGVQFITYKSLLDNEDKALKMAFDSVVLVRGNAQDRAVMTGLFDRVSRGTS